MTARLFLVLACLLGASSLAGSRLTRLEVGQKLFREGDIDGALKALDAAADEGGDATTLETVHLLRARCYSARQDFARTEAALALALEANPAAELDPAKVDPTLVKMLNAVRNRLFGSVHATSTPPGAVVRIDGAESGPAPRTLKVPVGKHTVDAAWPSGPPASVEVMVRPRRAVYVAFVQGEGAPAVPPPQDATWKVVGDIRGTLEVPSVNAPWRAGLDLGGGVERGFFRLLLSARLFPYFGLTPRGVLVVPVMPKLSVYLELAVPFWLLPEPLPRGLGLGIGGAGGAEFHLLEWFGVFAQLGGQHFFLYPYLDPTRLTASAGVRLRLP